MNTQDEALSVIQSDREAAAGVAWKSPAFLAAIRSGQHDDCDAVQAFAKHRLSHSTPGDAEVRKALAALAGNAGALGFAADEIRAVVGNTNWQCLIDAIAAADAILDTPSGRAQGEVAGYLYRDSAGAIRDFATKPVGFYVHRNGWTETPLYAAPPAQDQGEGR